MFTLFSKLKYTQALSALNAYKHLRLHHAGINKKSSNKYSLCQSEIVQLSNGKRFFKINTVVFQFIFTYKITNFLLLLHL